MKNTVKVDATPTSISAGMIFVDKSAKRTDAGRRFVVTLSSASKNDSSIKCVSWYEFDGAPKNSSISAARLLAGRDYTLMLLI